MSWQRANVQAAANYLRERITAGADDPRSKAVYEGLLDVLDPARRTARLQRESAASAKSAVTVQAARERRNHASRERRRANAGPPAGVERRAGRDRRGTR
jgi:hypothetical protein